MTAAYTLFVALDPTLLWQVAGHFFALHVDALMAARGHPAVVSSDAVLGLGGVVGVVTTLNFIWFPLLLLDGRTPIAVSAFRKLCAVIAPVHVGFIAVVLINAAFVGFRQGGLITPLAFVAIPATPLLYFIVKPLFTMRWLDLAAPPEAWEKLIGLDGSGKQTIAERGGTPSRMSLAILVPPIACFRARFYWRGAIAGGLWFVGLVLLFVDPLRALLPFVAAAAIGRQVGLAGYSRRPSDSPVSSDDRMARLRRIFTPERLQAPPFALATGLLSYLFVVPFLFVVIWFGVEVAMARSVSDLFRVSVVPGLIIPFVTIALTIPSALIMPLGFRFSIWWYRLTGALVIVVYVLLLGFFWHLTVWPFGPVASGIVPVLRPVAVFLTIMAPALVGIALSLRGAGGLPRLARSSGMTG
ncbi:hypothetical protein [Acidiphilium angustum]|nr:hypothetical protein [Acidiphilium angustum]